MSTDLPDFLSDEPSSAPETPAAAVEGQAPEAAAPAPEPTGDQPQPLAAAPAAQPEPHAVPLATFLDLRDRASAAEKEAKELREWRQQQQEAAQRRPIPVPDRYEDPEGYEQFQALQQDQAQFAMRLDMSRGFAEMRHGAETVTQAYDWGVKRCDEDPFFNAKVRASKDPVGLVVAEWQRDRMVTQMTPDDVAAFQAWKAAQTAQPAAQHQAQPAAAAAPVKPAAPRPSLAAGPSAGASAGVIPRDGAATFDAMFNP